jgi:hypothetical protein
MRCSRLAREFLHFLHIFDRPADARQTIEFTSLLDFLHFLLALRWTTPLTEDSLLPLRLNAAGRDDRLQD